MAAAGGTTHSKKTLSQCLIYLDICTGLCAMSCTWHAQLQLFLDRTRHLPFTTQHSVAPSPVQRTQPCGMRHPRAIMLTFAPSSCVWHATHVSPAAAAAAGRLLACQQQSSQCQPVSVPHAQKLPAWLPASQARPPAHHLSLSSEVQSAPVWLLAGQP